MTYTEGVKALRKKLLLAQAEMANHLGVAFASVNRWENGEFKPTMKARRKLASLFGKRGIVIEE